jgi:DNA-binding NtrC family response regulator
MRSFLRRSGHAVVEAASVEEAQKLMSLEGLTHVVTDLAIGEGSGLDVAEKAPSGIPVLIVTGLPPSDALHQKAKAAHPVLPKPFDFATFEAAFLRASL